MMSSEMNAMMTTMPAMQQGPVEVRVSCFEATAANIATLRRLTASAAGASVSTKALTNAGMKAREVTASLSTTVKAIRADVLHATSNAPVADDGHTTVFAVARTSTSVSVTATAADPLISLVDNLTVGELMECPQIDAWKRSPLTEVCVGASEDDDASSPSLVLFYARDTALGCSGCCLGACLGAMCAALCCCCMCSD